MCTETISKDQAEQTREMLISHFRAWTHTADGDRLPDEFLPTLYEPGFHADGWTVGWDGGPDNWPHMSVMGRVDDVSGREFEPATFPPGVAADALDNVILTLYPR